jgi:hypothetical protein
MQLQQPIPNTLQASAWPAAVLHSACHNVTRIDDTMTQAMHHKAMSYTKPDSNIAALHQ